MWQSQLVSQQKITIITITESILIHKLKDATTFSPADFHHKQMRPYLSNLEGFIEFK